MPEVRRDTHILVLLLEDHSSVHLCLGDMAIHKVALRDTRKLGGFPVDRRGHA